uniref:Uncharacterized protein n=2 Tax=viral metagenome TaxID=1070528 RepID=A0A6H1ZPG8_9ZZZZ
MMCKKNEFEREPTLSCLTDYEDKERVYVTGHSCPKCRQLIRSVYRADTHYLECYCRKTEEGEKYGL